MKRAILAILLMSMLAFGQTATWLDSNSVQFTAMTATGTSAAAVLAVPAANHTLELDITGGPAGCSVRLLGSVSGVAYHDISGAQACTSSTTGVQNCTGGHICVQFSVQSRPERYIKVWVETLSGGTSPSVTPIYSGK